MTVVPLPTRREARRRVDLRITPGQLDAALTAAAWPSWTGRANCPVHLAPLTPAAHAAARRLGVDVADECLMVSFGDVGLHARDWADLYCALWDVAPDVICEVDRDGLLHVETDTDLGVPVARAWCLLGVGVAS